VAGKYIPWQDLLRRTFGDEIVCPQCGGAIRIIALVKTERVIQEVFSAMHFPTGPPKGAQPSRPVVEEKGLEWDADKESTEWPE